jgi:hypothetical protein
MILSTYFSWVKVAVAFAGWPLAASKVTVVEATNLFSCNTYEENMESDERSGQLNGRRLKIIS